MALIETCIKQETGECIMCYEANCTRECRMGMDPAKILRSLRFDNDGGALLRLKETYRCTDCDGECDAACVLPGKMFSIRTLLQQLNEIKEDIPETDENIDLSCEFLGIHLENPFLLSSSVVASTYEKMSRAFEMGWAGACFKTICDFIPHEASPRYSAVQSDNSFYGFKNIEQLSCNTLTEDLDIIRR